MHLLHSVITLFCCHSFITHLLSHHAATSLLLPHLTLYSRIKLPVRPVLILHTFHRHFFSSLLIAVLCPVQSLCLLLSGDTELNPRPTNFTVCTLNIRSIRHPLHSAALSDLIVSHHPDLFCLTETWLKTPLPALNLHTVLHVTTLLSTPISLLRAVLLQSLVVVLAFLHVNPSLSCLLPCPSFPHLNTSQLLSSCLSLKSLSSISNLCPHHLPSLNLFLFFLMNLTPFSLSLPPHLMNL